MSTLSLSRATQEALTYAIQSRQIAVPAASALAVHTRSAQLQDKVEQQHLKRLVLNYEQREEAEELKGTQLRVLLMDEFTHLP